jgi:hypothetical protein
MSLAILGLFKALSPLFPASPRRFVPVGMSAAMATPQGGLRHPTAPARVRMQRPLRVTRLVDQGCAGSSAGRMVMSGRFDDVCAELDRLVALESAREAARHHH